MNNKLEEILGRSIDTTKALKKQIVDLQNVIKDLGTDEESLKAANDKLNAAQAEYTSTMNAGKQATDVAADSIRGMELEMRNMRKTYMLLTEEQRNSKFGVEMAESLKNLSEEVNNSKMKIGDFKDNIGRYTESAMKAFKMLGISVGELEGPMKIASQGIKGIKKEISNLEKGTVVVMAVALAFKALMAIVDKVKAAINANEESQMKLKEAMAAFQPIINAVTNAFDVFAQGVVSVINILGKLVNAYRIVNATISDFLHLTKGKRDAVKEEIAAYKDLAKSQNVYIKKQRDVNKENATDKAKVEELRAQAAATTDLNERVALLNDAKTIQAEIDRRNIELAEENLRILQTESEFTANDAEANERLAAAEAAVGEARAAANAKAKEYNEQIRSLTESSKKYQETLRKEKDALEAIELRIKENTESEVEKLTKKYKEEKALMEKYHKDTTELTKQYNEEVNKLNDKAEKERLDKINEYYKNQFEAIRNAKEVEIENIALSDTMKSLERAKKTADDQFKLIDEAYQKYKQIKEKFDESTNDVEKNSYQYREKLKALVFNDGFIKKLEIQTGLSIKEITDLETEWFNAETNVVKAQKAIKAAQENLKKLQEEKEIADAKYRVTAAGNYLALFDGLDKLAQKEDEVLQKRIDRQQQELLVFKGTQEEKIALEIELDNLRAELNKREIERTEKVAKLQQERFWQAYDGVMANVDAISSMLDSYSALYNAQIKDGNLTEAEAKKKQKALATMAKVQKTVGIISVVADTAAGITSIWQGYAKERVANAETAAGNAFALAALNTKSLISAIANTTAMASTGIAQVASIKGNYISQMSQFKESSADSGAATPAYAIDSTPYSYTRQLQTDQEREDELNKPIIVKVSDIEEGLETARVRVEESTF